MSGPAVPVCFPILSPYGSTAIEIRGASGCSLFSRSGQEFIDLTSGWNVANLGWSHPSIVGPVMQQLSTLPMAPAWCLHEPVVQMSERLSALLGFDYGIVRAPTGTQAIEFALRAARRLTGRYAIVSVGECYHGSTLGSLAASGIAYLQREDAPLVPFHRALPLAATGRALDEVRQTILTDPLPAAVLLEPVFSNPGAIDPGPIYVQTVVDAARSCGALVIVDEIGTGLGRVGPAFGFHRWSQPPDMVTLGKSLGGGVMPMAALALRRDLARVVQGMAFDSTFAGTPAGCTAAVAVLELVADGQVFQAAQAKGERALRRLQALLGEHPAVREVRGTGLLLAVELAGQRPERLRRMTSVVQCMLDRGLFCAQSRHTDALLVMPPLVIDDDLLDRSLQILAEVVDEVHRATRCGPAGDR